MSAARPFRARVAALVGGAVLVMAIAAVAATIAAGPQPAKSAPTACPDAIACHALKRAATPAAPP